MLNIKNILKEADVILFICTLVVTKYLIDDLKREKEENITDFFRVKV